MSYFKQIDTWLNELLAFVTTNPPKEELDKCKKDIKDELLKSYRNGQATAGKKAHAPEHEAYHEGDSDDAPAAIGAVENLAEQANSVAFECYLHGQQCSELFEVDSPRAVSMEEQSGLITYDRE
jgi:hypothetical protein